jgi:hypothetical protein
MVSFDKEVTMNEKKQYSPEETAAIFGISTEMLAYYRRHGKIKGTQVGRSNMYTYTDQQIREATIPPPKSARKKASRDKESEEESEYAAILA